MEYAAVVAILVAAVLLQAAMGFGAALIAMPLLALLLPLRTVTPLVALVMLTVVGALLVRTWRHVDLRSAAGLVAATVAGLPFGLLLLHQAPDRLVRGTLGVLLIAYAAYNLLWGRVPAVRGHGWTFGLGFVAGLLGGAYNTNGPPIVLYGAMRRWPPDRFRATLQSYFLPATAIICTSHAATGLWTRDVFVFYLWALPFIVPAVWLGLRFGRGIPAQRFDRLLHGALLLLGALMLV